MATINDTCDYITIRLAEAQECSNLLKVQKLLYYCQAWSLAFFGNPLFDGKFQAWIHGPVNREIYDRFNQTKSLYSQITDADIQPDFLVSNLSKSEVDHINNVLDVYAAYTGSQLESMTHNEEPWLEARKGFRPSQRCFREIDENLMQKHYSDRL